MTSVDRWQLPDGVEEILPAQAEGVERLRRQLLDLYRSWGYQLVIPPLVEFTESLLVGLGEDLDLLTFKVTDQLSGRTLGVRADITPQVARIDAHSLAQEGVTRLCYAGSVLHTRPKTLMASRSPIQLGAELYGDDSLAADVEVIRLMLASLEAAGGGVAGGGAAGRGVAESGGAGLDRVSLDLGHVGVYEAVLDTLILNAEQEQTVFDALQRKSVPDLQVALADADEASRELVIALVDLHGDESVLGRARELFAERVPAALAAIDAVQEVAADILGQCPDLDIYYDLAELRGYHYHTGVVFAAYVPGHGQALANGGRYNDVGSVFGRARPATGFAIDLKALVGLVADGSEAPRAISMPDSDDPALARRAGELRLAGHIVINCLSSAPDPRCDRQLVERDGDWVIEDLPPRGH